MSHSLAAAMFPDAPGPWLELASSFTVWVLSADDELERCVDEREARACVAAVSNAGDPRWSELLLRLSVLEACPRQAASFMLHVHEFLDGCVWEAANRARGSAPSSDSYRTMRPHTGAILPFLRLALALGDVSLDAECHPLSQQLLRKAAWLPCLANDLISAEKELAAGDFHNCVILRMHETGETLSAAHHVLAQEYAQIRAAFARELGAAELPFNQEQRRLLANLVSGADRWQADDARYRAARSDQAQPGS
jgi:hypothetical protein